MVTIIVKNNDNSCISFLVSIIVTGGINIQFWGDILVDRNDGSTYSKIDKLARLNVREWF